MHQVRNIQALSTLVPTHGHPSPNHKVYVTVTIHFEEGGVPVSMLLNLVEVT
jgi:hypothetical protein